MFVTYQLSGCTLSPEYRGTRRTYTLSLHYYHYLNHITTDTGVQTAGADDDYVFYRADSHRTRWEVRESPMHMHTCSIYCFLSLIPEGLQQR